ncbi:hypothetical protein AAY473_006426 [Plecturocebus cupreus]
MEREYPQEHHQWLSGELSLAYGALTSPGLSDSLGSSFGSGGGSSSFSCSSSSRAVVMRKIKTIKTHNRKLLSKSSNVPPK